MISNTGTHRITGDISGSGGVLKDGPGTMTLSGANKWLGPTRIRDGTLTLGAANALPDVDLAIGHPLSVATAGTLDMNGRSARLTQLFAVTQPNANAAAASRIINLAAGQELVVQTNSARRFIQVQMGAHLEVIGGGWLAVTNTAGTVLLWGRNGSDNVNHSGVDLSGLGEFSADVDSIVVGFDDGPESQSARQAVRSLANTNTICVGTLSVAHSPRDEVVRGRLYAGVSNRLAVGMLQIGHNKGTGWLLFRDDVAWPSLWISGRNPGECANISQWEFRTAGSASIPHGHLMVANAGATLHAYLDQWVLGSLIANGDSTNAGGRGIAEIRDGDIDVNDIILGRGVSTVSVGTAVGWLTLHGGTMAVKNGIVMGQRPNGGNIAGTLVLSGGVTTVYGPISDGGGTSTLILDGGTLDMSGNNIGSGVNPIDTLTMASGVLRNVGEINGGADWRKTSSGTLTIEGNNAYTGNLTVESGMRRYNGMYTGGGMITARNGATLGGTGSVAGIRLEAGATLAPGNSTGIYDVNGDVTMASGSTFQVELNGRTAGVEYDQLVMNSYGMTLDAPELDVRLGFAPSLGDSFRIVTGLVGFDPDRYGEFDGKPNGSTFTWARLNFGSITMRLTSR